MLQFLILLTLGITSNKAQSYQDSLAIYNVYKGSINTLKEITDPQQWYLIEESMNGATASAFRRLSLYNQNIYEPLKEFNREGFGVAFYYPHPNSPQQISFSITDRKSKFIAGDKGSTMASHNTSQRIPFSIIDRQTKFIIGDNGNTITPYWERMYFKEGLGLIKTERLDPITLQPITLPFPMVTSPLAELLPINN